MIKITNKAIEAVNKKKSNLNNSICLRIDVAGFG